MKANKILEFTGSLCYTTLASCFATLSLSVVNSNNSQLLPVPVLLTCSRNASIRLSLLVCPSVCPWPCLGN